MNAPVTRRALLGATAAVGAVGLPITATAEILIPASDLDAELFALIAQHAAAEVEMHRAWAAFDRATEAFEAAVPSPPDALRWREEDFPRTSLGLGLSTPIKDVEGEERREYQARGVGWLRDRPATTWFVTLAPPLDPECEARRLEILTAWDSHMAAHQAVGMSTGYTAAGEASDTAATLVCDLAADIARARPQTLPGLRALAAWFGERVDADDVHDDFLRLFAQTVVRFDGTLS